MNNQGEPAAKRDPRGDPLDSLFRELVEKANDIFIAVGRDGSVHFVSPSFCRLTGFSRGDVEGERIAALFDPGAQKHAQNLLTCALQAGGSSSVDLPLRKKSGDVVEISFRPSVERGADGSVTRMLLVGQSPYLYGELAEQFNSLHRDLKNYSSQLERLNAELEDRIQ